MVGARTDARLVNIPQSEAWARRIKHGGGAPDEVSPREVLQPMGATQLNPETEPEPAPCPSLSPSPSPSPSLSLSLSLSLSPSEPGSDPTLTL